MLYLEAKSITKTYGTRLIFDIPHIALHAGDRVGLVGENGAGKTTLMDTLAGIVRPDSGAISRFTPISHIPQTGEDGRDDIPDGRERALFRAQAYHEGLSGGEQTRRRIARALHDRAHVLLCDEPTTDLDASGVAALEKQLSGYEGAILLISHDRALLDALCTAIWELEDGHLSQFPGGYEAYRAEKARRLEFQRFEYEQYRDEQARLRVAIEGEKKHAKSVTRLPKRMGNSEARLHKRSATEIEEKLHGRRKALETRLEKLPEKERPREETRIVMETQAVKPIGGRTALTLEHVSLRVPGRTLLADANLALGRDDRMLLLGDNGCGKTTLLRHIQNGGAGVTLNPGARVGCFHQFSGDMLSEDLTALENVLRDAAQPEHVARVVLIRLGIGKDGMHKPVRVMSGGERVKVALARLLLSDVNVLIMDEPTNHLDIQALEALGEAIGAFPGAALIASHDRRFVEQTATALAFIEGGALRTFMGTFSEYTLTQREARSGGALIEDTITAMRLSELAYQISQESDEEKLAALDRQFKALAARRRAAESAQ